MTRANRGGLGQPDGETLAAAAWTEATLAFI